MRKIISFLLVTILLLTSIFSFFTTANAAKLIPLDKAKILYDLNLIKGTSSTFSAESLELKRYATRAEICVTIIRLLGKEEKALYQKNEHPFRDVPVWASDHIGWLYENYLVNGYSDTRFGSDDIATNNQFCTMLLRVLGYSDAKGDFKYSAASSIAYEIGIAPSLFEGDAPLSRENMVVMMYNALGVCIQNSSRKLVTKLCDENVLDPEAVKNLDFSNSDILEDHFSTTENTLGDITVKYKSGKHIIGLFKEAEHYGIRVFVAEEGSNIVTEVRTTGAIYFKKGKVQYYNGDPAGYISEISVYGLNSNKNYSFIVLKTSSEGDIYKILGKSDIAYHKAK